MRIIFMMLLLLISYPAFSLTYEVRVVDVGTYPEKMKTKNYSIKLSPNMKVSDSKMNIEVPSSNYDCALDISYMMEAFSINTRCGLKENKAFSVEVGNLCSSKSPIMIGANYLTLYEVLEAGKERKINLIFKCLSK